MSTPTPPSNNNVAAENATAGENELASCLLSQYRFCTAGIGLGTAYALRYKKGVIPMLAAGAIGTSADMVYGYLVECAAFRDTNGSSESGSAGATVVSSSIPQSKNTSPTASSGNSTT